MKAEQWIDRVKAVKGIDSDYGVAKLLNLSRQAISKYRSVNPTMNEETSIKVAEALGLQPAQVLLDQIAEATKDKALQTTLFNVSRRLSILCKVPETYAHQFMTTLAHAATATRLFS